MSDHTSDQLRRLLEQLGLSQRAAARKLEIKGREFRRMCAGQRAIPTTVMLALQQLAQGPRP